MSPVMTLAVKKVELATFCPTLCEELTTYTHNESYYFQKKPPRKIQHLCDWQKHYFGSNMLTLFCYLHSTSLKTSKNSSCYRNWMTMTAQGERVSRQLRADQARGNSMDSLPITLYQSILVIQTRTVHLLMKCQASPQNFGLV